MLVTEWKLKCDNCNVEGPSLVSHGPMRNQPTRLFNLARASNWRIYGRKHFCPDCKVKLWPDKYAKVDEPVRRGRRPRSQQDQDQDQDQEEHSVDE